MFELLKKKISGFVESIAGKEERKPEAVFEEKKAAEAAAPIMERREERARETGSRKLETGRVAGQETAELERKVRKDIFSAVKETITGASEIKESEVGELLDELELGLIESDVALEVAEDVKKELRKRVVGAKIPKGKTAEFVKGQLRETLIGLVGVKGFSIPERVRETEKPAKVMIMGPNGSGKTTTIAKITKMLQNEGLSVVIAASDTFRAAAVEQLRHHGDRLGVKVVSGAYGSDPTALAFDAVEYAKAHGADAVLIDTAGRQDTNINLINQLKKMDRVIAPQLKIYVGESIAGNAIVEQISVFHKEIGLDGVILTKLDCDAKGGAVVSVSKVTGLPVIYVGTGQGYGDIEPFDPDRIIGEILS
ncbi:MAG: signal recognition particle-docking protein FtsY [Candidatus Micrarchaeota archaeon]